MGKESLPNGVHTTQPTRVDVTVVDPQTGKTTVHSLPIPQTDVVPVSKIQLLLLNFGKIFLWCLKNPDVFLKWGLVILVVRILRAEGFTLETLVKILKYGG